jgi:hypothetical protein
MTAPMGTYNEIDAVEGYGSFEMSDEAIRPFGPAGRVFVPGGLNKATLNTPKGPATLNLPAPVPTLTQFRALEQAVNNNNQRVTTELTRLRSEIAARNQQGIGGIGMMPLLFGLMAKNRFDTHVHEEDGNAPLPARDGGDSFTSFLPLLLLLQPGLLGGVAGSRTPGSGSQDAISPLLLMLVLTKFLK